MTQHVPQQNWTRIEEEDEEGEKIHLNPEKFRRQPAVRPQSGGRHSNDTPDRKYRVSVLFFFSAARLVHKLKIDGHAARYEVRLLPDRSGAKTIFF